jgi:hypothetical protein
MKAYNLADLEQELQRQGWTLAADAHVVPQEVPGQVQASGYRVVPASPSGDTYGGDGPTRADASRRGGQCRPPEPDDPNLV